MSLNSVVHQRQNIATSVALPIPAAVASRSADEIKRLAEELERKHIIEQNVSREVKYFALSLHGAHPVAASSGTSSTDTGDDDANVEALIQELLKDPKYVVIDVEETIDWAKQQKLPLFDEYNSASAELDSQLNARSISLEQEQIPADLKPLAMKKNRIVAKILRSKYESMIADVLAKQEAERKRLDALRQAEEAARKLKEEEERRKAELLAQKQKEMEKKRPKSGSRRARHAGKDDKHDDEADHERIISDESSIINATNSIIDPAFENEATVAEKKDDPSLETAPVDPLSPQEDKDTIFYVILRDYPRTLEEAEALIFEKANFDAVFVISQQEKPGPMGMTKEERDLYEQQLQEQQSTQKKGAKPAAASAPKPSRPKSAAKKGAGQKRGQKQQQSSLPFYLLLRQHLDNAISSNIYSPLRSVMYLELAHFTYTYDDSSAFSNDGNDTQRELRRLAKRITEEINLSLQYQYPYRHSIQADLIKNRLVVGAPLNQRSDQYYQHLLSLVPEQQVTIPIIMHAVIEQVVRNVEQEDLSTAFDDNKIKYAAEKGVGQLIDLSLLGFMHPPAQEQPSIHDQKTVGEDFDMPLSILAKETPRSDAGEQALSAKPVRLVCKSPAVKLIDFGDRLATVSTSEIQIQDGVSTSVVNRRMTELLPVLGEDGIAAAVLPDALGGSASNKAHIAPAITPEEKGARLTELTHFVCRDHKDPNKDYLMTKEQMRKELLLLQFEDMLQKHGIPNIDFESRQYRQDFSRDVLIQVLAEHMLIHKPKVVSAYDDLEDVALVGVIVDVPACRFLQTSVQKHFSIPRSFAEFVEPIVKKSDSELQQKYDLLYREARNMVLQVLQQQAATHLQPATPATEAQQPNTRLRKPSLSGESGMDTHAATGNGSLDTHTAEPEQYSKLRTLNLDTLAPQERTERYVFEGIGADFLNITNIFYPSDGAIILLESICTAARGIQYSVVKDGALFSLKITCPDDSRKRSGCFRSTFEDGSVCIVGLEGPAPWQIEEAIEKKKQHILAQEKARQLKEETEKKLAAEEEAQTAKKKTPAIPKKPTTAGSKPEPATRSTEESPTKSVIETRPVFDEELEGLAALDPSAERKTETCFCGVDGLFIRQTSDGIIFQSQTVFADSGSDLSSFDVGKGARHEPVTLKSRQEFVDVWSHQLRQVTQLPVHEIGRAFLTSGDIVRKFDKKGVIQMLHSNGNMATRNDRNEWIWTFEDGSRRLVLQDGTTVDLQPLNFAVNVDHETLAEVYSREDAVMTVRYSNRSLLVQHADGTRFWHFTKQDGNSTQNAVPMLVIEKENNATVQHIGVGQFDQVIHLEHAAAGIQFRCKLAAKQIAVLKDGHSILVNAESNHVDVEPCSLQLQRNAHAAKDTMGIYSFNICKGSLKTIDLQGHAFVMAGAGQSIVRYNNVTSAEDLKDLHRDPFFDQPEQQASPPDGQKQCNLPRGLPAVLTSGKIPEDGSNRSIHSPRLFVINRDGSGFEYLSEQDVVPLLKAAEANPKSVSISKDSFERNVSSLTILTKKTHDLVIIRPQLPIPKCILPAGKMETKGRNSSILFHRRIVQYAALTEKERQRVRDGVQKWRQWCSQRDMVLDDFTQRKADEILSPADQQGNEAYAKAKISEMLERRSSAAAAAAAAAFAGVDNQASGTSDVGEERDAEVESGSRSPATASPVQSLRGNRAERTSRIRSTGAAVGSFLRVNKDRQKQTFDAAPKSQTPSPELFSDSPQDQSPTSLVTVEAQKQEDAVKEREETIATFDTMNAFVSPEELLKLKQERANRITSVERRLLDPMAQNEKLSRNYWKVYKATGDAMDTNGPTATAPRARVAPQKPQMPKVSRQYQARASPRDTQNQQQQYATTNGTNNAQFEEQYEEAGEERQVIPPSQAAATNEQGKLEELGYTVPRKWQKVTKVLPDRDVKVKSIRKQEAPSQINQDYRNREHETRRQVRTASMMQTKQQFAEVDPLYASNYSAAAGDKQHVSIPQHSQPDVSKLSVFPAAVRCGPLKYGELYTQSVLLTNFGNLPGRFNIRFHNNARNQMLRLIYKKGPIAPGMSVKIEFEVNAAAAAAAIAEIPDSTEESELHMDIQIVCEESVVTLPVIIGPVYANSEFEAELQLRQPSGSNTTPRGMQQSKLPKIK